MFEAGPIRVARFGKLVQWQSRWQEVEFDEFQQNLAKQYPGIVTEIDQLVREIALLVSKLPPLQLLLRARQVVMLHYAEFKPEAERDIEDVLAVRMVDYIQSLIASVPPSHQQRTEVTDEDWSILQENVQTLFWKVSFDYPRALAAKERLKDASFDQNMYQLKWEAQLFWCNVRGHQYESHIPAYLNDLFLPHSKVLQEVLGIRGEEFVNAFVDIRDASIFGMGDAMREFESIDGGLLHTVKQEQGDLSDCSKEDLRELWSQAIEEEGLERQLGDVFGRLFGLDLYDVEKITNLPRDLLNDLAWSPGEDQEFFAEGDYQGWPLRIWPIFKRPFIRVDGRFYCFDIHPLFDNLYRVIQRIVARHKPEYREQWNQNQSELSERLPLEYFKQMLPGATEWRSVFYKSATGSGKKGWCETDGLLVFDDHLFVFECRGGAFSYTSPAVDFPSHIASLENLVVKPANQGKRFLDYLSSSDCVSIFDHSHQKVGELRQADFRHITIVAVTLDSFTELAARLLHLSKIGVETEDMPVWSVSLDDLRAFVDVFTSPLIFLHFIEQRMQATKSEAVECNDELDHLGLYLKHNHYVHYMESLSGPDGIALRLFGYRSELDRFFSERVKDPTITCWLGQEIPSRIGEVIELLTDGEKYGRSRVAAFLLDISTDWREILSSHIEEQLKQLSVKRAAPYSSHGDVRLTLFCWKSPTSLRDADMALDHARAVALINSDENRLLLELTYGEDDVLEDASWQWVTANLIPEHSRSRLQAEAERLRNRRIKNVRASRGKIGRNDPCPCGSGKKWKKCCLGRH